MSHLGRTLGWAGIFRLALVQTALGSIIVLTTSTMNRVMVVELALPALVPGVLVALHHLVQLLRPRFGHGSDVGGRRTPWIIGGMATLAAGGVAAAVATAWMATDRFAGTLLGIAAFVAIGVGAGAAGTSLLVLMAKRVDPAKRAAAATIAWVMMIAGFIVTAGNRRSFPRSLHHRATGARHRLRCGRCVLRVAARRGGRRRRYARASRRRFTCAEWLIPRRTQ